MRRSKEKGEKVIKHALRITPPESSNSLEEDVLWN